MLVQGPCQPAYTVILTKLLSRLFARTPLASFDELLQRGYRLQQAGDTTGGSATTARR